MSSRSTVVATPRLRARKREQDDGRSVVSLLQIRAANNTPVAKLLAAMFTSAECKRERGGWKKQPQSWLRGSRSGRFTAYFVWARKRRAAKTTQPLK